MKISKVEIKLIITLLEKTIDLKQDLKEELADICKDYDGLAFPALIKEIGKINPAFAGELESRLYN